MSSPGGKDSECDLGDEIRDAESLKKKRNVVVTGLAFLSAAVVPPLAADLSGGTKLYVAL